MSPEDRASWIVDRGRQALRIEDVIVRFFPVPPRIAEVLHAAIARAIREAVEEAKEVKGT